MTNPFMELISSGEGDYNSYNRGTSVDKNGKFTILGANQDIDFSQITIAEIQRRQLLPISDKDRLFAIGKYQLIPPNLNEGIRKLKIDASDKFTPDLQDILFNDYIISSKRPEIKAYITGQPDVTLHDAQKAICKEWASVEDPDTPGHVYAPYEKFGNKMHTTAAQVRAALDEMRAEYRAQIDRGLSAEEAWRTTAAMGPGQLQHVGKVHAAGHRTAYNVLREGARGPGVGELQTHLKNLGYTDAQGQLLAVDNHFGRNTRGALEAFQHNHGLNIDGIAGPNTWAALREAAQAQSAITTFPRMMPDLDVDAIRTLQQHLNTLGVTDHRGQALSTTGLYDDATRAAVMNFQSAQRLPKTGAADPSTYALIEARATFIELQQITAPTAYANDTNQQLAIMQAQLPEMHQQVEAMERQRPAEREKDDALSIPNEAVGHDAHPSFDTRNDYVPVPQTAEKLGYSDPRHPVHALYADVKQRLEAQGHHLPEDRLTQITGELHLRQFQPNWDGYIRVQGDTVHAGDYHPWGGILTLDLKEPAPSVHETMQQVDTQQQAFAQELALRAQQTQSLGHGQALSL